MGGALVAALAAIGGILTIVGAVASAWAYFKSKQMESTLQLMATANTELRGIVEDYANRLQKQQTETAELRGQVKAMQSEVVIGLVSTAQEALKAAITEAIRDGFRLQERGDNG